MQNFDPSFKPDAIGHEKIETKMCHVWKFFKELSVAHVLFTGHMYMHIFRLKMEICETKRNGDLRNGT